MDFVISIVLSIVLGLKYGMLIKTLVDLLILMKDHTNLKDSQFDVNSEIRGTEERLDLENNVAVGYVNEAKEVMSNSKDNLNAAAANFLVNVEATISLILVLNAGITDPKDKIQYGFGIMSIFLSYLLSYLMSNQPFFKGLSLTQAYIIQYQINQYGKNSLYFTCILSGVIMIGLTAAKCYRINKITPQCILVGIQFSIGTLQ